MHHLARGGCQLLLASLASSGAALASPERAPPLRQSSVAPFTFFSLAATLDDKASLKWKGGSLKRPATPQCLSVVTPMSCRGLCGPAGCQKILEELKRPNGRISVQNDDFLCLSIKRRIDICDFFSGGSFFRTKWRRIRTDQNGICHWACLIVWAV